MYNIILESNFVWDVGPTLKDGFLKSACLTTLLLCACFTFVVMYRPTIKGLFIKIAVHQTLEP